MRLDSIRTRTLMALILICVAIVFIMGGIWLHTTSQNIKKTVSTADLHDSRLMVDYVRMYVESVGSAEALASGEPGTINALEENNSSLARAVFDGLVAATPQDDAAFLVDRNGTVIYHTYRGADAPPALPDLRRDSAYVTGIFYSAEFNDYVFAIVSPVVKDGAIAGYVYDEVRPGDLYAFLAGSKGDFMDQVVLADATGRVILSDDRSLAEQHGDLSSYPPIKKALAGEGGFIEHPGLDGNTTYLSAYYPISDIGWVLVVSSREDAAYRPLQAHVVRIAGMSALFIVALTAFGYFASMYLIDPIERLSGKMRKVSEGDYGVSIEASRHDEVGDLECSFNALVSGIKKRDNRIRAEKDRSDFYLDLMGHDINNMNHAGMGYLELAMDNLKGRVDDRDLALIVKTRDALDNSSALIDSVRKIKRVKASRQLPAELDLSGLLAEVRDKYTRYPGRDITITYAAAPCKVRACGLFLEVLSNVVENAIKHSDPSKPLAIVMGLSRITSGDEEYCRMSIEDNGPGIPDRMKDAIFNRSFRGPTDARGRGLGLYIVKMLVEECGGKVWAEDRVPGNYSEGSRFIILLPAASEQ